MILEVFLQWSIYKLDKIGVCKKWSLYGNVYCVEIPPENKYLAQIKPEIGMCYGFLSLPSVESRTDTFIENITFHLNKRVLYKKEFKKWIYTHFFN